MLLLTREASVILEGMIGPSFYVTSEDYLLLCENPEFRIALLNKLGVDSLIVDWLGEEVVKGSRFERKESRVVVPDIPAGREMGYYHRL